MFNVRPCAHGAVLRMSARAQINKDIKEIPKMSNDKLAKKTITKLIAKQKKR